MTMRGIIVLADRHYVTCSDLVPDTTLDNTLCANLANGGCVRVPREKVIAFEEYQDHALDAFRDRLRKLDAVQASTRA